MSESRKGPPDDDLTAAVAAALDEALGADPVELVEEQPPDPGPPADSGLDEERYRSFPARFGG
jgi:hypothetical protein